MDVRIGKVLLFGAIFRCLDSALTIAACPSYRTPFASPFGKREEAMRKKMEFAVWNSDVLSALRAFHGWSAAAKKGGKAGFVYAKDNFLSVKTLQTIVTMKHQVYISRSFIVEPVHFLCHPFFNFPNKL